MYKSNLVVFKSLKLYFEVIKRTINKLLVSNLVSTATLRESAHIMFTAKLRN